MPRPDPNMPETDQQRALRVLEELGYSAKPEEFEAIAQKFTHDKDALQALRAGVIRHGRGEDSGDWTSSATPGYANYRKKMTMLEQAQKKNDLAFLDGYTGGAASKAANNAFAPKTEDDDALQRMQKQIDDLQSRVRKLEGARFRLDHKP